jgi:hypothetical protein
VSAWRDDPDALARAIVRDPRYRGHVDAPPGTPWWHPIVQWIRDRLHDLFHGIGHVASGLGLPAEMVGIVLLGAGAVGLVYLLVRLVAWYTMRTNVYARERGGGIALDAIRSAADLRAAARAAASRGAYREAARLLFGAALRALDELGRIRYDAALTPGEYRRAVRDPRFDVLAREATVALFATREPDAALVERMEDAYDGLFARA